jgi:hypothetical protein
MTWTIRIKNPRLRYSDGETTIEPGTSGDAPNGSAKRLCRRGDAVRIDGCQATTADGTPCTRDTDEGSDYCHQHHDDDGG